MHYRFNPNSVRGIVSNIYGEISGKSKVQRKEEIKRQRRIITKINTAYYDAELLKKEGYNQEALNNYLKVIRYLNSIKDPYSYFVNPCISIIEIYLKYQNILEAAKYLVKIKEIIFQCKDKGKVHKYMELCIENSDKLISEIENILKIGYSNEKNIKELKKLENAAQQLSSIFKDNPVFNLNNRLIQIREKILEFEKTYQIRKIYNLLEIVENDLDYSYFNNILALRLLNDANQIFKYIEYNLNIGEKDKVFLKKINELKENRKNKIHKIKEEASDLIEVAVNLACSRINELKVENKSLQFSISEKNKALIYIKLFCLKNNTFLNKVSNINENNDEYNKISQSLSDIIVACMSRKTYICGIYKTNNIKFSVKNFKI